MGQIHELVLADPARVGWVGTQVVDRDVLDDEGGKLIVIDAPEPWGDSSARLSSSGAAPHHARVVPGRRGVCARWL